MQPDDILNDHTPEVRQIAQALRKLVRETVPEASEVAYPFWHAIGYRHPRLGYFCGIFPQKDSANLLFEFGVPRRVHPLLSARLAAAAHPVGIAVLVVSGVPGATVFALLHGAGNGMMTIAKGTLPLALFGPGGYGARQGWLMMPMRVLGALAPVVFGIAVERLGAGALWVSAAVRSSSTMATPCVF